MTAVPDRLLAVLALILAIASLFVAGPLVVIAVVCLALGSLV